MSKHRRPLWRRIDRFMYRNYLAAWSFMITTIVIRVYQIFFT